MIIIKVQYTVKTEYVETNRRNIKQVMSDLRALKNPDIKYSAYLEEDGCSFMHFATYPDQETLEIATSQPSFVKFQNELKASVPTSPPKVEHFTLVDSSY